MSNVISLAGDMRGISHYYQNVTGFFNFEDLYRQMVRTAPDKSHFVELGALWGKSSIFMAVEIKNSGKDIKFDVVDYWDVRGVPELAEPGKDPSGLDYGKDGPDILYEKFLENVERANCSDVINPVRMGTVDASELYEDESLDFVFIDANHTYDAVKADINCWLPKVRSGGILAGHDYDWVSVRAAVDEKFGKEIEVLNTSWVYNKP